MNALAFVPAAASGTRWRNRLIKTCSCEAAVSDDFGIVSASGHASIIFHLAVALVRYCRRTNANLANGRLCGTLLLGPALPIAIALTHHPAIGPHHADIATALASAESANRIFHAGMIAMIGVLYLGLVEYARRRGLQRVFVIGGLVAATAGLAAETGAGLIDGFFVTGFAAPPVLAAGSLALQILAKFGLCAAPISHWRSPVGPAPPASPS